MASTTTQAACGFAMPCGQARSRRGVNGGQAGPPNVGNSVRRSAWLVAALALGIGSDVSAQQPPRRYLAVLTDGRRIEGDKITGWDAGAGTAVLDGAKLAAPERPLRWLRDRSLRAFDPRRSLTGFIELAGGDRLPGKALTGIPGRSDAWGSVPPGLVVQPGAGLDAIAPAIGGQVTVDADRVRRVVCAGVEVRRRLEPGTVFFRGGRRLVFRSLRWGDHEVHVLATGGIQRFPLADVAEIHLRSSEVWEPYFRELAVLAPRPGATLVRLETVGGLIVTGSTDRFRFISSGSQDPNQWRHVVQPAWCRQPLWVRSSEVRTWRCFAPHEVPLSRIPPSRVVQRSTLGGNWPWQADRSADGGDICGAGQLWAWGLGVHAANELTFPLPDCARAFRARVGLDRSAGSGGCAIARVYVHAASGKPLFETQPLVGSEKVVDTGAIGLPARRGGQRRLVLVADEAHRKRPPGADPFDIRDQVNWIEPLLILDPAQTRAEIARCVGAVVPGWRRWTVRTEGDDALPVATRWDASNPQQPRFVTEVAPQGKPLVLSAQRDLSEEDRWLVLDVRQAAAAARGKIEIRAGGEPIARLEVPPPGSVRPMLVPLERRHRKRRKIEVAYAPGDARERTEWRALVLAGRKTRTDWRPLEVVSARSMSGAELSPQSDGSLLSTAKPDTSDDTYLIEATSEVPAITALRLEVLPDPTLPSGGPGRAAGGNFHLAQLCVGTPPRTRKPIEGRYVRIEQPGQKRSLSVSEVEVYAPVDREALVAPSSQGPAAMLPDDPQARELLSLLSVPSPQRSPRQTARLWELLDRRAEDIAGGCRATQSSTEGQSEAKIAVDGSRDGGVTRTKEQDDPWWEVDLGGRRSIDRIVVCCAAEYERRPAGFTVVVLDQQRKVQWKREGIPGPPMPAVELVDCPVESLELRAAAATAFQQQGELRVAGALEPTPRGWASGQPGQPNAAVFTLGEPVDPRATGLYFQLKHCASGFGDTRNGLGRFRLLATGDSSPLEAEPVGIEVPLLDAAGQGKP